MTQLQEPPTHLHRNGVRHAHADGWARHTHDGTTGAAIRYPSVNNVIKHPKEKQLMTQPKDTSTAHMTRSELLADVRAAMRRSYGIDDLQAAELVKLVEQWAFAHPPREEERRP